MGNLYCDESKSTYPTRSGFLSRSRIAKVSVSKGVVLISVFVSVLDGQMSVLLVSEVEAKTPQSLTSWIVF